MKIKSSILATAAIVGLFAAVPVMTISTPAMAREAFSFSFDTGNVQMGYRNGYFDRDNRWHTWRNAREAREYRNRYRGRYRDSDHDGIPNRVDRDRDNDGVPNRFDDRPNNPYRN